MDNTNYHADLENWLKTGHWSLNKKFIYFRFMVLDKKPKIKEIYESMIASGIKFPTEYKLKGKKIIFARQADCQPEIFLKRKRVCVERPYKSTKVSGFDLGVMKQAAGAIKGALKGEDVSDTVLITDPEQYFSMLCTAMFELLYNRISEKHIKGIRAVKR